MVGGGTMDAVATRVVARRRVKVHGTLQQFTDLVTDECVEADVDGGCGVTPAASPASRFYPRPYVHCSRYPRPVGGACHGHRSTNPTSNHPTARSSTPTSGSTSSKFIATVELLLLVQETLQRARHTGIEALSLPQHRYIAVLLLMMWGFAGAFFTTFKDDPAADGFESLPLALLSMLNYAVRACRQANPRTQLHDLQLYMLHTR